MSWFDNNACDHVNILVWTNNHISFSLKCFSTFILSLYIIILQNIQFLIPYLIFLSFKMLIYVMSKTMNKFQYKERYYPRFCNLFMYAGAFRPTLGIVLKISKLIFWLLEWFQSELKWFKRIIIILFFTVVFFVVFQSDLRNYSNELCLVVVMFFMIIIIIKSWWSLGMLCIIYVTRGWKEIQIDNSERVTINVFSFWLIYIINIWDGILNLLHNFEA